MGHRWPTLRTLLISLSLVLTVALFWGPPLLQSLQRPSVTGLIEQRQLELRALAAQTAASQQISRTRPPADRLLQQSLLGRHPLSELADTLAQRRAATIDPLVQRDLDLRRALVLTASQQPDAARRLLDDQLPAPSLPSALLSQLDGDPEAAAATLQALGAAGVAEAVPDHPLYRRITCEVLQRHQQPVDFVAPLCQKLSNGSLLRLGIVAVAAPLGLIAGVGVWLHLLWRLWRQRRTGRGVAAPVMPINAAPLGDGDLMLFFWGGFVVLGSCGSGLALLGLKPLLQTGGPVGQAAGALGLYVGQALPALAVLWLLLRQHGDRSWQWLKWHLNGRALLGALRGLLLCFPLVLLVSWIVSRLLPDAGGSNPLLELVLESRNPLSLVVFAVTATVLAPLYEELVFRGVLLPALVTRFGAVAGVAITSALFAVAHLSLVEFAPLFVLGIVLGWLRLKSGGLSRSVLMHAAWNGYTFVNLVLLGF